MLVAFAETNSGEPENTEEEEPEETELLTEAKYKLILRIHGDRDSSLSARC